MFLKGALNSESHWLAVIKALEEYSRGNMDATVESLNEFLKLFEGITAELKVEKSDPDKDFLVAVEELRKHSVTITPHTWCPEPKKLNRCSSHSNSRYIVVLGFDPLPFLKGTIL